jgi:hypothetical protein
MTKENKPSLSELSTVVLSTIIHCLLVRFRYCCCSCRALCAEEGALFYAFLSEHLSLLSAQCQAVIDVAKLKPTAALARPIKTLPRTGAYYGLEFRNGLLGTKTVLIESLAELFQLHKAEAAGLMSTGTALLRP